MRCYGRPLLASPTDNWTARGPLGVMRHAANPFNAHFNASRPPYGRAPRATLVSPYRPSTRAHGPAAGEARQP